MNYLLVLSPSEVIFPEKFRSVTITACYIKTLRMLNIEAPAKKFLSNLPDSIYEDKSRKCNKRH